jgi:hypothetical protein
MSRVRRASTGASNQKRVFIFAEDRNDAKALQELITALCPSADGSVERRIKPLLLAKGASPGALQRRAARLAAHMRAESARGKRATCIFLHEDADAHPPADRERSSQLYQAARAAGIDLCPVVPAWEMEAWWFLFPAAVASAFPSWRPLPSAPHKAVDRTKDAKEALRRATGPRGTRRYSEADAPRIASEVRRLGLAERPTGHADAYVRFRSCVDECCATLQ